MSAFVERLKGLLDQLEGELDGWGSDLSTIRSMDRDEIAFAIQFARELRFYSFRFQKAFKLAEGPDQQYSPEVGVIDRIDHPVLRMVEAQKKADLERAARIRRRSAHLVSDNAEIPDEVLVFPSEPT